MMVCVKIVWVLLVSLGGDFYLSCGGLVFELNVIELFFVEFVYFSLLVNERYCFF